MPIERITTTNDIRLRPYQDLPRRRHAEKSGLFVAEGGLLFDRLLASVYEIQSVVLSDHFESRYLPRIPDSVPVYVLPDVLTKQLVGFNFHRGIVSCGVRRRMTRCHQLTPPPGKWTIVVASLVQQDDNLGGLLRNCAAFGVDQVILSDTGPDPFGRRALRTAMGTTFSLELVRSSDLHQDLHGLQKEFDLELFATVIDASAEPLAEVKLSKRIGLVFGAEGDGIDDPTVRLCQRRVTIPMQLETDSLNVAVASGIVLHHFMRLAEQ